MKFFSTLLPLLSAQAVFAAKKNDIQELEEIIKQAQNLKAASKGSLRAGGDIRDSLASLLENLEKYTKELPEDLKQAVDKTNELVGRDPATDNPHRKLQQGQTRKQGASMAVDALGHLSSVSGMGRHLQLHDAIVSGDLSFAKSKLKSLGRKLNKPRMQDIHHRRRTQESDQKAEQCQELVDCASGMTVYDLL